MPTQPEGFPTPDAGETAFDVLNRSCLGQSGGIDSASPPSAFLAYVNSLVSNPDKQVVATELNQAVPSGTSEDLTCVLHYAVPEGQTQISRLQPAVAAQLITALKANGVAVNRNAGNDFNPLELAVRSKSAEVVGALLAGETDVAQFVLSQKRGDGTTALHMAATMGLEEVARLLVVGPSTLALLKVEAGGKTALDIALLNAKAPNAASSFAGVARVIINAVPGPVAGGAPSADAKAILDTAVWRGIAQLPPSQTDGVDTRVALARLYRSKVGSPEGVVPVHTNPTNPAALVKHEGFLLSHIEMADRIAQTRTPASNGGQLPARVSDSLQAILATIPIHETNPWAPQAYREIDRALALAEGLRRLQEARLTNTELNQAYGPRIDAALTSLDTMLIGDAKSYLQGDVAAPPAAYRELFASVRALAVETGVQGIGIPETNPENLTQIRSGASTPGETGPAPIPHEE